MGRIVTIRLGCRYLLKAGSGVNAQTGTGDTALTYACENGHTDVASILLESGAELVSTPVPLVFSPEQSRGLGTSEGMKLLLEADKSKACLCLVTAPKWMTTHD